VDLLQIVALAIIQGVTEFLPVGADTHLALAATVLAVDPPGVSLALHLGAVLAVTAYFHGEIGSAGLGLIQALRGRRTQHTKLAGKLLRRPSLLPASWVSSARTRRATLS